MRFQWRRAKRYHTKPVKRGLREELNHSQGRVKGFDLATYQSGHAYLVGAGGLNSPVAITLARKGIGRMSIMDDDRVELKNLTRQLYFGDDVGKYKAHQLGHHAAKHGLFPTNIKSYPFRFQELVERRHDFCDASIIICGVDNNRTRQDVSAFAQAQGIPVIHAATSTDGAQLYVMIERPGGACWGCALPTYLNSNSYPCDEPGILDVLLVAAGLIVFAVDVVLCERHCDWNYRRMYLCGSAPDRVANIERVGTCRLCGSHDVVARQTDALEFTAKDESYA